MLISSSNLHEVNIREVHSAHDPSGNDIGNFVKFIVHDPSGDEIGNCPNPFI
jgi:hypothetical protein